METQGAVGKAQRGRALVAHVMAVSRSIEDAFKRLSANKMRQRDCIGGQLGRLRGTASSAAQQGDAGHDLSQVDRKAPTGDVR